MRLVRWLTELPKLNRDREQNELYMRQVQILKGLTHVPLPYVGDPPQLIAWAVIRIAVSCRQLLHD